jgi:hypothetical protein
MGGLSFFLISGLCVDDLKQDDKAKTEIENLASEILTQLQ